MFRKSREVRVLEETETGVRGARSRGPVSDEELVDFARKGHRWALEELVDRYQKKAYVLASHLCFGDKQEAEDITQEAFLRVLRGLGRFRGESSFYTWFRRILVNLYLDRRKGRRRWERLIRPWRGGRPGTEHSRAAAEEQPDTRPETNPAAAVGDREFSSRLRKALSLLPDKQRLVFKLKVLEGMEIREIARVMGTAEGTVKSHLFRATRFLRGELKEWG